VAIATTLLVLIVPLGVQGTARAAGTADMHVSVQASPTADPMRRIMSASATRSRPT
jgi:hypothetical protein